MFTLQLVGVVVAVLAAAAIAAYALRTPPSRHGRRRGVRHGLPTEIRRHRRRGHHTWERTLSVRVVPAATQHALDALDTTAERRRYVVANLIEATGEITSTDLAALLGPRPAELVGAAA
jgi:hypothetical protein